MTLRLTCQVRSRDIKNRTVLLRSAAFLQDVKAHCGETSFFEGLNEGHSYDLDLLLIADKDSLLVVVSDVR